MKELFRFESHVQRRSLKGVSYVDIGAVAEKRGENVSIVRLANDMKWISFLRISGVDVGAVVQKGIDTSVGTRPFLAVNIERSLRIGVGGVGFSSVF